MDCKLEVKILYLDNDPKGLIQNNIDNQEKTHIDKLGGTRYRSRESDSTSIRISGITYLF
jgi:hypothetical protein